MASPLSSNSSAFLALPVEIRRQIYGLCIPHKFRYDISRSLCYQSGPDWFKEIPDHCHQGLERGDATEVDSGGGDKSQRELSTVTKVKQIRSPSAFVDDHRNTFPGLLLCCHQITEEVTDMLYKENTLQINIQDESTLENLIRPNTRQKIRKMVLILRPRGLSHRRKFRMNPDIWDGILGNLQTLGVVVEQPDPYFETLLTGKKAEDVFADWIACITPILEYVGQALHREAKIVVDANEHQKTVKVIKEAISERCHFQRLSLADFIFVRGRFASASAFWGRYWGYFGDDSITAQDCMDDDDDFALLYSNRGPRAAHRSRTYRRLG
ncbi:uncharacterized protein TrAtP1_013149 [Trichoderma atroviride]|uniref:uncharacterized protein n=1 Tax=Hypocrea atroviridis TaxID=63577 RepID=UPI00332BB038|nr:hypothetical protein TrAtP1_013149 [Trichoderma atroviride]